MVTEDQSEVVAFLQSPAAHGGAPVERVDTHASVVFLSGDRALKLKRAVRYDYLDFSTAEKRKAMCEAELRVNRRTAPAIYRAVIPVTRVPDGGWRSAAAGLRSTGCSRWPGSIRTRCWTGWRSAGNCPSRRCRHWPRRWRDSMTAQNAAATTADTMASGV